MPTTLNYWPWLDKEPKAYFVAPNGHHVSGATPAVAAIFDHLVQRLHREVEPCQSIYGYRRSNTGVNPYVQDTNHASATAFDYNGARHLYEPNHKTQYARDVYAAIGFSQDQIDHIRAILRDINKAAGFTVLRWGGDFGTKHDPSGWRLAGWRDPMHFEIYGTHTSHRAVSAADAVRAAAALGAQTGSDAANPGGPIICKGDEGSEVEALQRYLNSRGGVQPKLKVDKKFGDKSEHALKQWQANNHLEVDGRWGPACKAKRRQLRRNTRRRRMLAVKGKIRKGDHGRDVAVLQMYLNSRPHVHPKVKVDRVFGDKTEAALKQWQRNNGLTPDAVWGPDCHAQAKRLH